MAEQGTSTQVSDASPNQEVNLEDFVKNVVRSEVASLSSDIKGQMDNIFSFLRSLQLPLIQAQPPARVDVACAPPQAPLAPPATAVADQQVVPLPAGPEVIVPAPPRRSGKRKLKPARLPSPDRHIVVDNDVISLLASSEDDLAEEKEEGPSTAPLASLGHMGTELTNSLPTLNVGGRIGESLALHVTDLWGSAQDCAKYKEIKESIKVPDNVPILNVQRCNKLIYDILPSTVSGRDKDKQQTQKQLASAAVPIVRMLNALSEVREGDAIDGSWLQDLITNAAMSLKVLSYENQK